MSLTPALFPSVFIQKASLDSVSYDQEREDIGIPTIIPFISGQSTLDSPEDQFLFSLFKNGWINREGQRNPEKIWPKLIPFGKDERNFIRSSLLKNRKAECTLQDNTKCSGSYNLFSLFSHLQMFQAKQNNFVPPAIHFIGSELHELEHKFDWSLKNLRNLPGIEIPDALLEAIKKRTTNDSDWRYYPQGILSSQTIQSYSLEILNYLTQCIYRDSRDLKNPPDLESIFRALHKTGLQKFHFYDSKNEHDSESESMCYATVGLADSHTKPVDILLVKKLNGDSLCSFDDCHLSVTTLMIALREELRTGIASEDPLKPESEFSQDIDMWQHLIHQFSYSISSQRNEVSTSKDYLRYIAHRVKGGRSQNHFEKALFKKIFLNTLVEDISSFHKKHPKDLEFKQAFAVIILFSLIEQGCSHDELIKFSKEILGTFTEHNNSLYGLILQALHQNDISLQLIYQLVHLLSFISLGAPHPSTNKFYLHFEEDKGVFDINYGLLTKGDLLSTLKELQTNLKQITAPESLNILHQFIENLLPAQLATPDQKTVLKFYKDYLKFNYSQIEGYAQQWLHEKHSSLRLLGVHLSFVCASHTAKVISLKEWISYAVKHQLRELISIPIVSLLDRTPRQNLRKAIASFANDSSDWVKTLIAASDRDTFQEVSEIVAEIENTPVNHLSLLDKISSFNTLEAWSYFVKIESTLKDEEWLQSLTHLCEGLTTTTDATLTKSILNLILNRKLSGRYPLHSLFISFAKRLVEIEGPFAADLFLFLALDRGVIAPHLEQTASLCNTIFDAYLHKSAPEAVAFLEKSERKAIWNPLPNHFSLLQKIDRSTLNEREIHFVHKTVVEEIGVQIDRVNFKRAHEIAKEFSKLLTAQDLHAFLLQRGRKCLQTQLWQQASDIVKQLLKNSELGTTAFVEEALNTFLENKVSLFIELLTTPEIPKTPFLRKLAIQYLQQEPRSRAETMQILVFLLKGLNSQALIEKEIVDLLNFIIPLLEQITEPISADFAAQLTEKKASLISSSPVLTIRFLSSLTCRKIPITFPKKIALGIYSQMLQFLKESRECNKIHLLLITLKDQLVFSEQILILVTELTSQLLDQKELQKAELWIPHITNEALLIRALELFVESNHKPPVLSLFEKLKNVSQLQPQIHSIIKLIAEQSNFSPPHLLGLLLDFAYPVSALWTQTLDKLRTVRTQEPSFLKALQRDTQFLSNFKQQPDVLHQCLMFASETLCKYGSSTSAELRKHISFSLSLISPEAPRERVAFIEVAMNGLILSLKTNPHSETMSFLLSLEKEREKVVVHHPKDFSSQSPGLGWIRIIAETLIRYGSTDVSRVIQKAISRIELDELTPTCIEDIESLALLSLKKEIGEPFLKLFIDYPNRFLPHINLEYLFKALSYQKNTDRLDVGFCLIQQVVATVDEDTIDRNSQLAIINFAAKATAPHTPEVEVYPILVHKVFNELTRFKAELFNHLFTVQAVQIAQLKDQDSVIKTLSCLVLRLKDLSTFPQGESQCIESAFSLLLHYLGWSKKYKYFRNHYELLIETSCNLQRVAPVNVPNASTFPFKPSPANRDKLFQIISEMISRSFNFNFPNQLLNNYLLTFVWDQFLFLSTHYPDKHKELLPLMEKALYTPWINHLTDLDKLFEKINNCITPFSQNSEDDDLKMIFRFRVFLNLDIDNDYFKKLEDKIPIELLKVVEMMLETKNLHHTVRVIVLLKRFHSKKITATEVILEQKRILIKTQDFYAESNPKQMIKIYSDLIDLIIQDPFFQMQTLLSESINLPTNVINALYYNFSHMLSKNELFDVPNWKYDTVPFLSKWVTTLGSLCEKHVDKRKELYNCMLSFLLNSAQKERFMFFTPEYVLLVNQVVNTYLKIIKSTPLKSSDFEEILQEFSPLSLFQLPSKKDDPLLKKAFTNFIAGLQKIKHPKMKNFISSLQ